MNEHEQDPTMSADQLRQDVEHGGDTSIAPDHLRQLREAARGGKAAKEEAAQLRAQLAFAKAGIDLDSDSKLTQMFISSYQGPHTPEAIKQAAVEVGVMTDLGEPIPPEELRMHQAMQNASSGSDGDTSNEPSLLDKIDRAGSPDDIMKLLTDAGIPTTWNRS